MGGRTVGERSRGNVRGWRGAVLEGRCGACPPAQGRAEGPTPQIDVKARGHIHTGRAGGFGCDPESRRREGLSLEIDRKPVKGTLPAEFQTKDVEIVVFYLPQAGRYTSRQFVACKKQSRQARQVA